MPLDITSPVFEDGESIPVKYTCDGEKINPPLDFDGIPVEAISLLLVIEDLDADDDNIVHWLMWNIDPTIPGIDEDEVPEDAIEGYNDFAVMGYTPMCPNDGEHRYQFHLYALDTELEIDDDSTRQKVEKEIAGHILDEAMLIGTYSR